jgi:two-component system, chemotaxis family, protein-glutamate methylesterase/glutaminase
MSVAPIPETTPADSHRVHAMVVDDSVVVRGLVAHWLEESGDFEVVATAANGRIAVDALSRVDPDLVVLDIEMPEMDGLTALPLLLQRKPNLKVVVVSTLTQRNAELSLKCLSLGAIDYVAKPDGHRHVTTSTTFRQDLVERLKAIAGSSARLTRPSTRLGAAPSKPMIRPSTSRPQCLVIGASTGGPRAVEEVLVGMGSVLLKVPVLVVQHMPPMFTGVFADHLRGQLGVRACEPDNGELLVPGTVYIAPGGRHMGLSAGLGGPVIRIDDSPPVNFCRPAVDVLFRDAASAFKSAVVAVVLTGMGSDGTQGARLLAEAGAIVIAQDEATSTVWGMPGSVVRAGLAQSILPLEFIGPALKNHIAG